MTTDREKHNHAHPSRLRHWAFLVVTILAGIALLLAVPVVVFLINNRPPNIVVPTPKMPKPNGWDDFVKAGGLLRTEGPYYRPVKSWTLPEYETLMRENKPILDLVRRGLRKPYMHPPVRDLNNIAFTHYSSCRGLARALASEERYYSLTDRPGKAADSMMDCLELGVILPQGGVIMAALVGSAIEAIGIHDFPDILPKLTPQELAHVARRLELIRRKRVPYSQIILEEGLALTADQKRTFSSKDSIRYMANPTNWITPLTSSQSSPPTMQTLRLVFTNKSAMLRENAAYYKALATEQAGPYNGPSSVPLPANVWAQAGFLDNMMLGRFFVTRRETLMILLQTEVALRRYRFDHGRYPERLAQLAPKYLKSTPVDPFGLNKPLLYRLRKDGSFLLYSRGPNMKDDGGKVMKWKGEDTKGDVTLASSR